MGRKLIDEHGIAVTEEPVTLGDGVVVGLEDEVASVDFSGGGEGADEHKEGAAGEVEVGEEGVDDSEMSRGVEEELSGAFHGLERVGAVGSGVEGVLEAGCGFEHPTAGGANGDDAALLGFGG